MTHALISRLFPLAFPSTPPPDVDALHSSLASSLQR